MAAANVDNALKFFPLSSMVDATFWHIISEKKLNELKLNDDAIPISASFRNDLAQGLSPLITVNYQSFESKFSASPNVYPIYGDLIVTNTLEDFKNKDKQQLLDVAGAKIWDYISSGVGNSSKVLNSFILLAYLDLKKFVFYYWFAFPALNYPKTKQLAPSKYLKDELDDAQRRELELKYAQLPNDENSFCLVHISKPKGEITLYKVTDLEEAHNAPGKVFLAFADPSSSKDYPAWPLRNLLALVAHKSTQKVWSVICLRLKARSCDFSVVFDIELQETEQTTIPNCVGWEKNDKQKLLPRSVDMSNLLDPTRLAQNAVHLNLKLMRWRLVPDLNLEAVAKTKCLLLGAGTLGCNVARSLLGWGVEKITLVDNSKVSYSNPVRQSLFVFEDCLNGGKSKSEAAADALKRIYPNVDATGIKLSIPMPGHFITENMVESVKADVEKLEELIKSHDCVFLLMDTRESRWLPTVIAQSNSKLIINAALGFDTYLVQRHGARKLEKHEAGATASASSRRIAGSNLGCYYCNDVVAPGNSTRDRTLDQQCTVTRPGVSMIAAALAVELMVSVIQHPLGIDAPAPLTSSHDNESSEDEESCLGIVPHQIRGFLSRFQDVLPATSAFSCCTGCSPEIVASFEADGFAFLLKAFNDPLYLEELSGLKKLHEDSNLHEVWTLSDDDLESETSLT